MVMAAETEYGHTDLSREEVDAWPGAAVVEFGTNWCGHCQAAQPAVRKALAEFPGRHAKVEDGPGRPLGRSYRVKLWPTLVFLKDGVEQSRLVRPLEADQISGELARIQTE
jgi:thioredoxin 1